MKAKIDRKEVRTIAKQLLNENKTKQEVYEELVTQYKYRKEIADIVRYSPTKERLQKYSIWNKRFLLFLILITLLSFMHSSYSIWLVALITIVALKKFKYYYWSMIFGSTMIITSLTSTLFYGMFYGFETTLMIIFSIPVLVIFIIGGIYIPRKITPKYIEQKEKFINKKGMTQLRIVHIFEE